MILKNDYASLAELIRHLSSCTFTPPISSYVNVEEYSMKLLKHAHRYELWHDNELVSLVAVYEDNPTQAYITNISVVDIHKGEGVGKLMMRSVINSLKIKKFEKVCLEVFMANGKAIGLYQGLGFKTIFQDGTKSKLCLDLEDS